MAERFKITEEALNLPIAQKNEKVVSKTKRTTICVDSRLSEALTAYLMLKNQGNSVKIAKEEFTTACIRKELKKCFKDFDVNVLKSVGIDVDYFE